MASGDTIFQAVGYPTDATWTATQVVVDIPLTNESSQTISNGSVRLTSTVGTQPYGQGWPDGRSPFTPGKQYRVTFTEI